MRTMSQEMRTKGIPMFSCNLRSEEAEKQNERLLNSLKKTFPSLQMDWGYSSGIAGYDILVENPTLKKLNAVQEACRGLGIIGLYRYEKVSTWCDFLVCHYEAKLSQARFIARLFELACESREYVRDNDKALVLGMHVARELRIANALTETIEDEEVRTILFSIPERSEN